MAELDWGGLHCQSHVVAKGFAANGHKVFYMNRTLQRWPRLRHLITRLRPTTSTGIQHTTEMPDGITVINLWVGPPTVWLRPLNYLLIWLAMRKYEIRNPILITYVPTYNCIDLSKIINSKFLAYICYHNFDADIVLPDLLKSEKVIIDKANLLFADSRFLVKRLQMMAEGKEVTQAPPGVYFEQFRKSFRGDEATVLQKVCFFGGAGKHLDLKTYSRLCDVCEVHFIAVISNEIKEQLDPRIIVTSPVKNEELPGLLKEMDVLTILYRKSPYIDAVIPAKFFECIATGKPLLVSGLPELDYYKEYTYDTQNDPDQAIKLLNSLPHLHTTEKSDKQFELGRNSDFEIRYRNMATRILKAYTN